MMSAEPGSPTRASRVGDGVGGTQKMSHTFTKHHFHIVFGTKQRQKLIAKEIRPQLWSYIAGICRNKAILSLAIGGIEDHVHLLVELKPDMTVPKAVNLIKSNSS